MRPPWGYPFEGPLREAPPSPTVDPSVRSTRSFFAYTFLLACGGSLLGGGLLLVGYLEVEAHKNAMEVAERGSRAHALASGDLDDSDPATAGPLQGGEAQGACPFVPSDGHEVAPLPARVLEGCSAADVEALQMSVFGAIVKGAPLCSKGDTVACDAVYEASATEIRGELGASCQGPTEVVAEAQRAAGHIESSAEKAATLRGVFDALLATTMQGTGSTSL